jgi:hypothetical protein
MPSVVQKMMHRMDDFKIVQKAEFEKLKLNREDWKLLASIWREKLVTADAVDNLIKELKAVFPHEFFRRSEEFDGHSGGVWFSGESGLVDYYEEYTDPKLQEILDKHGFFIEPYDPGTMMAYPG